MVETVLADAWSKIHTKQELFLKLCSLNYLNALVKQAEYKEMISYGRIKSAVIRMVTDLAQNKKTGLCDEISVKLDNDCVYIRCYGVQFSFHHINSKILTAEWPELNNPTIQWDGVRLQPIAKELYELAKEVVSQSLGENVIKDRIVLLL